MSDSSLPPASTTDPLDGPRGDLAKVIPRRPRVSWWLGIAIAAAFAFLLTPAVTANRWLGAAGGIERGKPASVTVRVPPFAGYGHTRGGGVLVARGEIPDRDTAEAAEELYRTTPHGAVPFLAYLLVLGVLAGLFTHHMRRSTHGRLLRVQLVSLGIIFVAAIAVKIVMLTTALSVLVVPVALFAMVPTLVLDRIVGLATGTLAALVVSLLVPFDVGIAILLLVQAGAAGLVIAERPKKRLRAVMFAGGVATLFTAATYPLMLYLTQGRLPLDELSDPLHSAWIASAIGPALATIAAVAAVPAYQLLVGEITTSKLVELEDLSHPLLRQIANKAPGTWQHSLMMANMAELAANAIGANGRLVRVGAYFHDLGKSLQPKYFIENLEPGETSPHDKLPPEVSCDAIFAHVTEGIVTARKAGLHERIIDFMHMHHGNGVLEYFWAKTRENNPRGLTVEHFRYPGVPPQSRETAILSICDAVEAAARTLKKPEANAIDNLVQRIVYGKLHLGQLDESGLSMSDLRRVAESLRDTIRHANHGRIEYPWQKAQQSASASEAPDKLTQTGPRLDSLDRPARPDSVAAPLPRKSDDAFAATDSLGATPNLKPRSSEELATVTTAPVARKSDLALGTTAPVRGSEPIAATRASEPAIDDETSQLIKMEADENHELATTKKPDVDEPETSLLVKMEADDSDMVSAIQRPDLRSAQTRAQSRAATDPGRAVEVELPTGPMPTDYLETRPAPKFDEDDVVELKPRVPDASETDPRMRRVTNELGERKSSPEVAQFAQDAQHALDEAAKTLEPPVRPSSDAIPRPATASSDTSRILSTSAMDLRRAATEDPAARKRAATLPPRPATIPPPPLSRRAPTVPPFPAVTVPPSDMLRPPAKLTPSHLPGMTAPPPSAIRPPATDIVFTKSEDGDVTIEPAPKTDDAASTQPRMLRDDANTASTQPRMDRDEIADAGGDARRPGRPTRERDIDAPAVMRAFEHAESSSTQPSMPRQSDDASIGDVTSPNLEVPSIPIPDAGSSWGRGLAARLERQLDEDFGRETPTSPPTRAELQALMDVAPDATKQQSIEELERLHEQARHRESQPELELTRRAPHPTREVEEEDIESAIELAPAARRTAIGIAKKKPTGE